MKSLKSYVHFTLQYLHAEEPQSKCSVAPLLANRVPESLSTISEWQPPILLHSKLLVFVLVLKLFLTLEPSRVDLCSVCCSYWLDHLSCSHLIFSLMHLMQFIIINLFIYLVSFFIALWGQRSFLFSLSQHIRYLACFAHKRQSKLFPERMNGILRYEFP